MCSLRPDLAYADHPFMAAMLMRAGHELLGVSTLGARASFLVLGALFPVLVVCLARPQVGSRDAWAAAGLSLVAPATASLGLLAIPDVPLLFFAGTALLAFERATRTGGTGWWLLAGLAMALGLASHLRFVLTPLAFLLYLLATPGGRAWWRRPGPWWMAAVALPGLLPVLVHNLRVGFGPIRYQVIDRHGDALDLAALADHVLEQAIAVTPLLYGALLLVLVRLVRRWREGDDRAALFALYAGLHVGVYLLASPIADPRHAQLHWPAPGYLPLLVFAPALLRDFVRRRPSPRRRLLVALVPATGALVTGMLLAELVVPGLDWSGAKRPFQGWKEIAAETRRQLDAWPGPRPVTVAADNYKLAGNLEFALGDEARVYVLDHRKNHKHGRAPQFALWQVDEAGLRARGGDALVVVQRRELSRRRWRRWRAHLAELFEELTPLGEIVAPGPAGDRPNRVLFFRGSLRQDPDRAAAG